MLSEGVGRDDAIRSSPLIRLSASLPRQALVPSTVLRIIDRAMQLHGAEGICRASHCSPRATPKPPD